MTIAVAVSGGMDSLLALALLKERGEALMAVHGHFLPPSPAWERVASGLTEACAALGVPFYALDLHECFDDRVIKPFVAEYKAGLTPNPCAMCNPRMKFGVLFDAARNLGADRLATGHYVRLEQGGLYRGADPSRDQSYFLSLVPGHALARAVFPLGGLTKSQVPGLLAERGLAPPLASESREICFVQGDDYGAFLQGRGESLPGPGPMVLAETGEATGYKVIGRHAGLWRHTEGQRRGLGVSHPEPLYVLRKEPEANRLVVGPKAMLSVAGCTASGANLLVEPEAWPQGEDGPVLVQTRYRQRPVPAHVAVTGQADTLSLHIRFIDPADRPAPGQVAALYDQDGRVLAGGIIDDYEEIS